MKIGIVQLNTIIGDVDGNVRRGIEAIKSLAENGASVAVLTELFTTGYPPRDLLYRKDLISANGVGIEKLVEASKTYNITVVAGFVEPNTKNGQKQFFNAAIAAQDGKIISIRHKTLLPTYDVFAEDRYFEPGKEFGERKQPSPHSPVAGVFEVNGTRIGLVICEEAWNDAKFWTQRVYDLDPVSEVVSMGAQYVVSINASPYRMGVVKTRREMIAAHARKHGVGFCYVNQVGFNDDVGFDGNSFATNALGEIIYHSPSWVEDITVFDTEALPIPEASYYVDWQHEVLNALVTGVRDYWQKLGIKGPAIIGLSGGIDSAIVAYVAVAALGRNNVIGVGMPSEFSSDGSVGDAEKIARKLGVHFAVEPIKTPHNDIRHEVDGINEQLFKVPETDPRFPTPIVPMLFGKLQHRIEDSGVTDENLQARIRGIYLMAIANYFNGVVLSTGNKSEMAVGYCTIYGDMCGGLSVISDLYKTKVFDLCRWINTTHREEIIPWDTINKPPSAELRKDQKDQDSLPPYETLDAILNCYVERQMAPDDIVAELVTFEKTMYYRKQFNRGLEDDVYWVCQTVDRNEFKRKQAATGLKLTEKMFKFGWEHPIVHKLAVHGHVKQETGASPAFPLEKGKA
jgi:NAD+ synthase (glutamine-hydrolysing)